MKFANIDNRLNVIVDDRAIDLEGASDGELPSDPAAALARWGDVVRWVADSDLPRGEAFDAARLGPPSPAPSQMFAIGLNYAPHAAESGIPIPEYPFVFTKTLASLSGPEGDLVIDNGTIDWEAELVVVIGKRAEAVAAEDAWSYVAGVTAGQDFSDRAVQNRLGANSQPTLGKSRVGFGPIGPFLVTPDDLADADDIALECRVNGEVMQTGRTSELIFSVPVLIEYLSSILPLSPGDIIYTGTPAGVGFGRKPQVFLAHGDVVETTVEGVGTMRHTVVHV